MSHAVIRALAVAAAFVALGGAAQVQARADSLTEVRTLYEAAAYREALSALERLAGMTAPEDRAPLEQFRALCLFALNAREDAEAAVAGMLRADPLYVPALEQMAPRIRSAFEAVTAKLLPEIAQETYTAAKNVYEQGRTEEAEAGFSRALAILERAAQAGVPDAELRDVRLLAEGFRSLATVSVPADAGPGPAADLATAANGRLLEAATGTGVAMPADPQPAETPSTESTTGTDAVTPSTAARPSIIPPAVIRQDLPAWPRHVASPGTALHGVLEIRIGAHGEVESARMLDSVHSAYDPLLLAATRRWRYEPARKDGVPTVYVKPIAIDLMP